MTKQINEEERNFDDRYRGKCYTMWEAAKILNFGIGRTYLFKVLRKAEVLDHANAPYDCYLKNGWFKTVTKTAEDGTGSTYEVTLVTQKGLDRINDVLVEFLKEAINN